MNIRWDSVGVNFLVIIVMRMGSCIVLMNNQHVILPWWFYCHDYKRIYLLHLKIYSSQFSSSSSSSSSSSIHHLTPDRWVDISYCPPAQRPAHGRCHRSRLSHRRPRQKEPWRIQGGLLICTTHSKILLKLSNQTQPKGGDLYFMYGQRTDG